MPFDWTDYLTLAEELRQRTDEASLRTAISRGYYAAFHQARDYLQEELGVSLSAFGSVHKQLWREYTNRGRTLRGIGINGDRLNDFRKSADYDADLANIESVVESSFHAANRIFEYMLQIKSKGTS